MKRALSRLPNEILEPFLLARFDALEYEVISRQLGLAVEDVERSVAIGLRAVGQARKLYAKICLALTVLGVLLTALKIALRPILRLVLPHR